MTTLAQPLAERAAARSAAARDRIIAESPSLTSWFADAYRQIDDAADYGRCTVPLSIPIELGLYAVLIETQLWSEGFVVNWTSGLRELRVDWHASVA